MWLQWDSQNLQTRISILEEEMARCEAAQTMGGQRLCEDDDNIYNGFATTWLIYAGVPSIL